VLFRAIPFSAYRQVVNAVIFLISAEVAFVLCEFIENYKIGIAARLIGRFTASKRALTAWRLFQDVPEQATPPCTLDSCHLLLSTKSVPSFHQALAQPNHNNGDIYETPPAGPSELWLVSSISSEQISACPVCKCRNLRCSAALYLVIEIASIIYVRASLYLRSSLIYFE